MIQSLSANCVTQHSVRVTSKRNTHEPIAEQEVEYYYGYMFMHIYVYIICVCVWARSCVCVCACDPVFKHTQCKLQILANLSYFTVSVIWSGLIFIYLAIIDAKRKRLNYIFNLATFGYQKDKSFLIHISRWGYRIYFRGARNSLPSKVDERGIENATVCSGEG